MTYARELYGAGKVNFRVLVEIGWESQRYLFFLLLKSEINIFSSKSQAVKSRTLVWFGFLFFKAGFLCVALAVLELTL